LVAPGAERGQQRVLQPAAAARLGREKIVEARRPAGARFNVDLLFHRHFYRFS
jgi:hypothetical protein